MEMHAAPVGRGVWISLWPRAWLSKIDFSLAREAARVQYNLRMGLMAEIRAFPVAKNSVGIWWFGQNGFIFKSHEGTLVSTDLYLSNSCADNYRDIGVNLDRRVPVLLQPEEVEVD